VRLRVASSTVFALLLHVAGPAQAEPEAAACVDAHARAQLERNGGHFRASKDQLLVCADPACPALVRRDCIGWLDDLSQSMPSIVVVGRQADGRDVSGVELSVDGKPAGVLDGKPIEIDPGDHALACRAPDGRTTETRVVISAAERERGIVCSFPAEARPLPRPAPHTPASAPAPSAKLPVAVWILGGAGVVAAGFAGYFYIRAFSRDRELRGTCAPDCSAGDAGDLRTLHRAGDVASLVAVLSAGGALVIGLTSRPSPRHARLDLGPASARLVGRF